VQSMAIRELKVIESRNLIVSSFESSSNDGHRVSNIRKPSSLIRVIRPSAEGPEFRLLMDIKVPRLSENCGMNLWTVVDEVIPKDHFREMEFPRFGKKNSRSIQPTGRKASCELDGRR